MAYRYCSGCDSELANPSVEHDLGLEIDHCLNCGREKPARLSIEEIVHKQHREIQALKKIVKLLADGC